ncbi:MAG TPA: MFS transporter [Anaerolineae bacterium]|nr:MFS transporter [Anaerolineae bacterium]HOQ97866.1 MFS transporter [Anaerolineae bacterium]HPL26971.1 MFS transporter [Anaerolineae bacterium]
MRALLRNRALLVVGLAETVSGLGNWITALAVYALLIFRGGGGPAESSAILMAGLLPGLLCSPLAGWLCDRYDRKRLMIAGELLQGLAVLGLIFARQPALIYALLAVQAAFGSLLTPARQAAVPQLVARTELTQANALLQQLAGMIKIGGPFVAGLLLAAVAPHQAMIVDVISFLLSALILSRLPALPAAAAQPAAGAGAARSSGPGVLATLRQTPLLAFLFVATFLTIVLIMSYDVLSAIYTRDVLQGNESLFGLLVGLIGLGMVGATLALLLRRGQPDPLHDLMLGIFLIACVPAGLALGAALPAYARWLAAAGCLLGGLGNGLLVVQMSTLLQLLAPPALLGRLSGALQSTIMAAQLLAVLAVPLVVPQLLTVGRFFALAAPAVCLLGAACWVARQRGLGRLEHRSSIRIDDVA